ncbi:MAG TPA: MBL fold metallo-hydrolase [Rhodanobacteraceae bacterium]
MNATLRLDDVSVTRVVEWAGPIRTVADILPDTPAEHWHKHRHWLAPDFWNPATNAWHCHVQTWVIRAAGRTVLVDTGVGNDRERPGMPAFAHWHTDFLARLEAADVDPARVDVVINTHIHSDHVGWNTRLVDGAFVPTFPNAVYLAPQDDYDYFSPDNVANRRPPETEDERRRFAGVQQLFADSITPVERTGQLQLWRNHHDLRGLPIALTPAPGHTPGSSIVELRAGRGALFVGDLLHSPMQILHPDHRCSFDLDATKARASRRRILSRAAEDGLLLLPAHFPGQSAAVVQASAGGNDFAVAQWAELSRATETTM